MRNILSFHLIKYQINMSDTYLTSSSPSSTPLSTPSNSKSSVRTAKYLAVGTLTLMAIGLTGGGLALAAAVGSIGAGLGQIIMDGSIGVMAGGVSVLWK